ncbi:hypothetical protein [Amycolatopsis sp. VC5-11]|uniref:hypothetical protein n=1 Tax=Amycolatopsis sp. VC5-11 TaxID=3120156 RepID=UPI003008F547
MDRPARTLVSWNRAPRSAAKAAQLDTQALRDRATRRSWVTQRDTADALAA